MGNDIACRQCRPLEFSEGIFLFRDYSGTIPGRKGGRGGLKRLIVRGFFLI